MFRNPERWPKWFLIALLVKGLFFIFMLKTRYFYEIEGFWGASNGDLFSYLNPIEDLLAHRGYTSDDRLPGYGAVYLALRFVFSKAIACNALIVAQLLLASLSVCFLAQMARRWFKSDWAFYATFYSYLFSSLASVFDHYILTESFSASSFIFWLYFCTLFEQTQKKRYLLIGGAFLTWLVFLKPAHGLMLSFLPLIWAVQFLQKKLKFRQLVQYSLFLLLPFTVVESAWIVRNYRHYHQFVPLAKVMLYPASFWPTNYFPIRNFMQAWGGDVCFWFANSDIRWMMGFGNDVFLPPVRWYKAEKLQVPPASVYTSQFNADSLLWIRNSMLSALYDTLTPAQKAPKEQLIQHKLETYTASIRTERPFVYYLKAPFTSAYNFLTGKFGYQFLDDVIQQKWPRFGLKLYHVLLLILGGIGLFMLLFADLRHPTTRSLVWLSAIYPIILFNFVLRHGETRYLVPVWSCWAVAVGYLATKAQKRLG